MRLDLARRPGGLEVSLEIIDLLTSHPEPLGVTDIAKRLDMDKGNAHRVLEALGRRRIVDQDPESRRYRPGPRIMTWARQVLQARTIRDVAAPHLRQLWLASGETTHLACLNATGVVYLECLVGLGQGTTSTTLGTQAPTHCTATGKALIASLPTIQLHAHLDAVGLARFTRNTITDKAQLIEHLAIVRQRGYATDVEEFHPGTSCCASPISDVTGHVTASVGVSTPASGFVGDRAEELMGLVTSTADRISRELGFEGRAASSDGVLPAVGSYSSPFEA